MEIIPASQPPCFVERSERVDSHGKVRKRKEVAWFAEFAVASVMSRVNATSEDRGVRGNFPGAALDTR